MKQLSYSAVSTFQECRHKYYYSYVKKIEPIRLYFPFLIGNCVQFGVKLIFEKKDPMKKTMDFFEEQKKSARKNLNLNAEQEQELAEQEIVVRAILKTYPIHYSKFIKDVQLIQNEKFISYTVDESVQMIGYIDNFILYKGKPYIHELKTAKSITPDYVKSIQTSLQVAAEFHVHNSSHKEKLAGIIYDVIKKPSIRLKKGEKEKAFMNRLHKYYVDSKGSEVFYMETIKYPIITAPKVFNIFQHVAKDVLACKQESDFYHNFKSCNNYGRCEFYDPCMFGENRTTMANYKPKEHKNEAAHQENLRKGRSL